MASDRVADEVKAALAAAEDENAHPAERSEMLTEIAMGLQQRPRTPDQLHAAVRLYDKALAICPANERLLHARVTARKGTALQAIPEQCTPFLEQARDAYQASIPTLIDFGKPEELAEAEMNPGVVPQNLAGVHRARITDAISAHQRALRTFDRARYPHEFAILQNNLATAFLSIPFTDERGKMRCADLGLPLDGGTVESGIISCPHHHFQYDLSSGECLTAPEVQLKSHAVRVIGRRVDVRLST